MLKIPEGRKLDCIPVGRLAIDLNTPTMRESFAESPSVNRYVGGSPANTAVGLAKLGCRTGFIGKISSDSLGDFALNYVKNLGIDTTCIFRAEKEVPIGLAFTENLNGKTNLMMYRNEKVADLLLEPAEIEEDYIASSRCIIISGTALSASPSRDACFKALEYAKKHDLLIVFDIDYRPQVWKNKDEIAVYYSLCAKYAQIIIGSYEEFDLMDHLLKDGMDDQETAKYWFNQNAEIVIIKHGSEGSMAYEKGGRSYKIDIVPVNAVKSTGGGDSYSSAFMYGILSGRDVKDSLELATVSASLAVAAPCCSDAMVGIDVLEAKRKEAKENFGELVKEI
ncbi:MAG: 5-dehydro-2-deoxygluconokinase [Erysipelotrichaceae bacterium]|nr:5-dehydro-2-deoxygluconokinase [Erysipelotrichaceae bacterium]